MNPFIAFLLFASLGATTVLGALIWGGRCAKCGDVCCECEEEEDEI